MADPMMNVRDLQAWYGESQALHGVDVRVEQGEVVALLGRNGAGKTTLLRAVSGILRKKSGVIEIAGQDISGWPAHRVAYSGLGYVPEERGIFPSLNVWENLTLPPIVMKGGLSVEEIYELFPNLKERSRSPGTKLSGGEQQMLAIARVLRTGAKLLLLDEPTEGLAPVIVERIGTALALLKKRGFTCLLVEQNLAFARSVADRFYIMEDGKIVEGLPADAFEASSERLIRFLGI